MVGHLQVEMRKSAKKLLVLYPAVLHVDPASRAQPHIRLTSRCRLLDRRRIETKCDEI